MNITKERFEAWLENQPDNRNFYYFNNFDCAVSSFIKETTNNKFVNSGGIICELENKTRIDIPLWLRSLFVPLPRKFTALDLKIIFKQKYSELVLIGNIFENPNLLEKS